MIRLSYSTLNMLYRSSHCWINKQMGLKVPDNEFFRRGKAAHRVVQDHLSGKCRHKDLEHVSYAFPVVEEKDFDDRCRIEFAVNEKYSMMGFFDGLDEKSGRLLEIKSSSKPWSIGDFQKAMQRRIYSMALPAVKENILVWVHHDPSTWSYNRPRVYSVPVTEADKMEAMEWIMKGIGIIERGEFAGGLNGDGVCVDPYCLYGVNCYFKR